jgi:hypothetical protein
MLIEGVDYLFFRSAYYSGGPVAGLDAGEVAVVATRRRLFLAPHGDNGTTLTTTLARLLATDGLSLVTLEAKLTTMVGSEQVVELDQLASLTVWSRFFRQVRFKRRDRRATQVLALRGKDNHARFERFYAGAIAEPRLA